MTKQQYRHFTLKLKLQTKGRSIEALIKIQKVLYVESISNLLDRINRTQKFQANTSTAEDFGNEGLTSSSCKLDNVIAIIRKI